MSTKRNRLITTPEICDALMRRRESAIWKIIRVTDVDVNKCYGFLGEPGTLLYVPEPGYLNERHFVRVDGTAVQLIGKTPYPSAPPSEEIRDGQNGWEFKEPKFVPMWATRYWFKIKHVSYPKLPSELTDEEIFKLGFKRGEDDTYSFPGIEVQCPNLKDAFRYVFNFFHAKWREVVISGEKVAVLYLFDESEPEMIPVYEGEFRQLVVIPYIEIYGLEPVYDV
jgi:hypothetical protein